MVEETPSSVHESSLGARDELRHEIVRRAIFVLIGIAPVGWVYFAVSYARGNHSPWLFGYLACQTLMPAVLWGLRKQERFIAALILCCTIFFGIMSLMSYGPVAGVGGIFMMSSFMAISMLSYRALLVTIVVTAVSIALGPSLSSHAIEPFIWYRTGIALVMTMVIQGIFLDYMLNSLSRKNQLLDAALANETREREARVRATLELARSQQTESLGRLAGGIAHDVNNSLSVIISNTEFAQRLDSGLPPDVLEDIMVAARSTRSTIAQLMVLGRQNLQEGDVCAPGPTVSACLRSFASVIPESIQTHFEVLGGEDRSVGLSPSALEQMVLNLLVNAKDAMPEGGRLEVSGAWSEDTWVLRMTDTGSGMDEQTRQRALEPFFTTKALGAGNGLGLAMVDAQMRRCGGRLSIQSAVGEGTTIQLDFPEVAHDDARDGEGERGEAPQQRHSILVIEDDAAVRRSLVRILDEDGHRVVQAHDEASATDLLHGDAFSIVFTDCVMPRTHLPRLLDKIAETQPNARTVLCTGWADKAGMELVDKGVVTRVVTKPFDREVLRGVIRSVEE